MKIFKTNIVLFLIIGLLGCSKSEKDELSPFIKINLPENHDNFTKGDLLTYDIEFTDDFQLHNFKINIHSSSLPILKSSNYLWDTTIVGSTEGIDLIIKHSLNIPLSIDTGTYLFIVYSSDKEGNENWVARDFTVHNN